MLPPCSRREPRDSRETESPFLGRLRGERRKDFRPLGYDGDARLVGQCHIAEGGCLNACLRVVGESKDGSERKLGAGADESPKRHFRDQEGRGEVVRLGLILFFAGLNGSNEL